MRSAERLFAREGIDRATLRQIARAADQRNVAAVQYHFGGKDGLVLAIVERHQQEVDQERRSRLDELDEAGEGADLGPLLRVLVEPLASQLDSASGRDYLQIQTQRSEGDLLLPATRELARRIAAVRPGGKEATLDRFVFLLLFNALADRARGEASRQSPRRSVFVETLVAAIGRLYGG